MNCEHCGSMLEAGAQKCSVCGTPVSAPIAAPAELPARENMVLGMIGALVGALIGGASIVLLNQIGFVASISGFLLAVCTLKGYEMLGKRLTKKGIVFCILLMIVTPIIADAIDWAIVIMDAYSAYGATFFECLALVPAFLADGSIEMGNYLSNLGMLYLFVILGAYGTIKNVLKK